MKNIVMTLVILGSVSAFAEGSDKNHPCQQIKSACESAGFKKGDHKDKKGLWKDCVEPIMNGKSVAGVTVGSDVVTACKEKKAEHKAEKEGSK